MGIIVFLCLILSSCSTLEFSNPFSVVPVLEEQDEVCIDAVEEETVTEGCASVFREDFPLPIEYRPLPHIWGLYDWTRLNDIEWTGVEVHEDEIVPAAAVEETPEEYKARYIEENKTVWAISLVMLLLIIVIGGRNATRRAWRKRQILSSDSSVNHPFHGNR